MDENDNTDTFGRVMQKAAEQKAAQRQRRAEVQAGTREANKLVLEKHPNGLMSFRWAQGGKLPDSMLNAFYTSRNEVERAVLREYPDMSIVEGF